MTTYVSWFNKLIGGMANVGIAVKGVLYHAYPIRVCAKCGAVFNNGRCPSCDKTADWRTATCTKSACKSHNAFVFQTREDPDVFFIFCKKCNKFDLVRGLPKKPVKYTSNVPPPIGSKTKPNV
jgi:hypothetical protein